MKVAFLGLGKLGLPVALAVEASGHDVCGWDLDCNVREYIEHRRLPYEELDAQELLSQSYLRLATPEEFVTWADIIFVAIQTPHDPLYEGITRLPATRSDFDYRHLKHGIRQIAAACRSQCQIANVIVISTVLPGTIEREIVPEMNEYVRLAYNPFFIAMGTTIRDFRRPEFVLLGTESDGCDDVALLLKDFYGTIHDRPILTTTIKNAELIKIAYNTFIGMKIVYANTMMEICEKTGADVDVVLRAIGMSTTRLISTKYLAAGMADGGGCHPRDNIAMSWLARRLDLSHDSFTDLMQAREDQTVWLASLIDSCASDTGHDIILCGREYKAGTNITTGSGALLLEAILHERGLPVRWLSRHDQPTEIAIYFISCNHPEFATTNWPLGSVVIDPWGYVPERPGVRLMRIGRNRAARSASLTGTTSLSSAQRVS